MGRLEEALPIHHFQGRSMSLRRRCDTTTNEGRRPSSATKVHVETSACEWRRPHFQSDWKYCRAERPQIYPNPLSPILHFAPSCSGPEFAFRMTESSRFSIGMEPKPQLAHLPKSIGDATSSAVAHPRHLFTPTITIHFDEQFRFVIEASGRLANPPSIGPELNEEEVHWWNDDGMQYV